MKILLSPAKLMKPADDHNYTLSCPHFEKERDELLSVLEKMEPSRLKSVLKVSDKIASEMYGHYQAMKEGREMDVSPAILTYSGIAYQYMAANVFTDAMMDYAQNHLRILSGLYGVLRPLDGIVRYRLEMGAKLPFSLYDYWSDKAAGQFEPDEPVINLASEEYTRLIRKYHPLIDVEFLENVDGKWKIVTVHAKMARGAMVRYMAENQVKSAEGMQGFTDFGFVFDPKSSTDQKLVFKKRPE